MANKYLIQGATYCGDGTTSAEATSNGGVGAWNNINVFEGSAPAYGVAPAAGDVIYLRSKTSAGADITRTSATLITLGSAAATLANPITWVIDAGSVWAGVSGVITESTSAQGIGITLRQYNNLIASNYNLVISSTVTTNSNSTFFTATNSITQDIKIDTTANTTSTGPTHKIDGGKHINIWIRQGTMTYGVITLSVRNYDTVFISPKIEVIGPLYFAASTTAVFVIADALGTQFAVYGGEVNSPFDGMCLVKQEANGTAVEFNGLKYPPTMPVSNSTLYALRLKSITNGNDGGLGSTYYDYHFTFSSRFDGYYPTLNAQLESSGATPWAYSIYPYRTTKINPAQVSVAKLWTQSAAQKTVTLEFLWPTTFTAPNSTTVWMTVQYIDSSTGNKVTQSTLAYPAVTCATSTALWSATTYGPTLFDKYKLSLATQSNIKQDTQVVVSFFSTPLAASVNDIIMLCPDVVLS